MEQDIVAAYCNPSNVGAFVWLSSNFHFCSEGIVLLIMDKWLVVIITWTVNMGAFCGQSFLCHRYILRLMLIFSVATFRKGVRAIQLVGRASEFFHKAVKLE